MTLAQLERALQKLVTDALENGMPLRELERRVAALIAESSIAQGMEDELMRRARAEFTWVTDHTMDSGERRILSEIMTAAGTEFARIGDVINDRVVRLINRGLRGDMSSADMEQLVARAVRGSRGNAATIVSTALGAFDRGKTLLDADRAGVTRFTVAGTPPGAMSHWWCIAHYGKSYTRDQIRRMSNGTTLSVELHCGGWRCIHYWQPEVD
ncbi:MAG TPA: hypothetical protein VHI13_16740 [Candidatus Kapabacteria bacterium]|nr:hypothetical protein [Candidatus Kapabacteria bacterium]